MCVDGGIVRQMHMAEHPPSAAPRMGGRVPQRDFFLRLAAAGGAINPAQKSSTCRVPSRVAVFACRLVSAAARPRADPAALWTPLSHMLIHGFFLVQGLLIGCSCRATRPSPPKVGPALARVTPPR